MGTTSPGSRPTGSPRPSLGQGGHHPVGRGQPVGAAATEHHRVHLLDQRPRIEQVGLPGARGAAADVHATDGAALAEHHRGAGQPALAVGGVVSDGEAADHDQIAKRVPEKEPAYVVEPTSFVPVLRNSFSFPLLDRATRSLRLSPSTSPTAVIEE